jgi:hypothetical protein
MTSRREIPKEDVDNWANMRFRFSRMVDDTRLCRIDLLSVVHAEWRRMVSDYAVSEFYKAVTTLLIVALCSASASARAPADVSGTWDLEMKLAGDVVSTGVCTFKQDDTKLTGTCGSTEKFPISGQVQDHRVSWAFDEKQNGTQRRMEFAGELDQQGTGITGSCSIVGEQQGTFMMKKKQ